MKDLTHRIYEVLRMKDRKSAEEISDSLHRMEADGIRLSESIEMAWEDLTAFLQEVEA